MLKFLFQANFKDGSFVKQTQDDASTLVPGGSAFTDVKERIAKGDELVSFGLFSDEVTDTYAVDLHDSHFEVNGTPFFASEAAKLPLGTKFRLIYYRDVQRIVRPSDMKVTAVNIVFHIGWQTTTADGKNIQHTIAVK